MVPQCVILCLIYSCTTVKPYRRPAPSTQIETDNAILEVATSQHRGLVIAVSALSQLVSPIMKKSGTLSSRQKSTMSLTSDHQQPELISEPAFESLKLAHEILRETGLGKSIANKLAAQDTITQEFESLNAITLSKGKLSVFIRIHARQHPELDQYIGDGIDLSISTASGSVKLFRLISVQTSQSGSGSSDANEQKSFTVDLRKLSDFINEFRKLSGLNETEESLGGKILIEPQQDDTYRINVDDFLWSNSSKLIIDSVSFLYRVTSGFLNFEMTGQVVTNAKTYGFKADISTDKITESDIQISETP
jgi:hypothetical protein